MYITETNKKLNTLKIAEVSEGCKIRFILYVRFKKQGFENHPKSPSGDLKNVHLFLLFC